VSISFNRYLAPLLLGASLLVVSACSTTTSRHPTQPATASQDSSGPVAAGQDADAVVAIVPADAAAAFDRGLAAMDAERWREAEVEFETLIQTYPVYPGPFVNLAIAYRHGERDQDAEAMLQRALAIAPEHAAANNQLGMLYRERGEFEAAEAAYRRALAQSPDYALAHYNLGVLLDLYLQRTDEALEHYERYQALSGEADPAVGLWIADLRRRLGVAPAPEQLAQQDGL